MKKSSIIILLTSVCLIGVGLLISAISMSAGGVKEIQKFAKANEMDIDLPGNLQLCVHSDGVYFTSDENDDDEDEENYVTAPQQVLCDASEVEKIELEFGAGEFFIEKSETDDCYIIQDGNVKVSSSLEDGTLEIKTTAGVNITVFGTSVGNGVSAGELILYLPEKVYEEISVNLGAGECTGELPECKKIDLEVGAGAIKFDELKAEEVAMQVGAGECDIKYMEVKELNTDIAMGEFNAKVLLAEDLDAKVGMGEINIDIIGNETDYDYDVSVGAGEVKIGSYTYSGVGSNGGHNNGTGREIDVDCGMGEATIRFINR